MKRKPVRTISYKRAQFNLFYCLARVALDGELTLAHFEGDFMADSRIDEIVQKMTITPSKALGRSYPLSGRAASVRVELTDGRSGEEQIDLPLGDPTRFPKQAETVGKFVRNAEGLIETVRAGEIAQAVLGGDIITALKRCTCSLE